MLAPFLIWVTVARMVVAMLPVGLFFAAAADPATASRSVGLASGITLGTGLALWPSGRLLDRLGRWQGIRASLWVGTVALAVLSAGAARAWPVAVVTVSAVAAGACLAPMIAAPRSLLPHLIAPQRLVWASGVEAASFEVALIVAPVVAALVGRFGSLAVLLTASGALALTWLAFPKPTGVGGGTTGAGPLLTPPVLRLAGLAALLGLSGGLLEPGLAHLPPPVSDLTVSTSLLFVAVGVGSAAGGLLAARTGWPRTAWHAAPLFALHGVAVVLTFAVDGAVRLVLLLVAGLPIAPLTSLAGLHLDRWSDSRRVGETFGVVTSVLLLATGVGQAVAARAVTQVAPEQLVLSAAVPALLAAVIVAAAAISRSAP